MNIALYSPGIKRKEMDAVLTVMVDEKIGPGEQAKRLVALAKEHLAFDYALSLRSPAIALELALRALAPEAGSFALVSALCPAYYLRVLESLSLVPLFCDTAPGSPCIHADSVRAAIERSGEAARARVIIVSETLGFMPDMPELLELGLPVIEDTSTAFGSTRGGVCAGRFGTLSILGLEERDALTAGGGALLFAAERRNAAALRSLSSLPGEYGLADMNAAMATVQIRESAKNAARRREIAAAYTQSALRSRHKVFGCPDGFEYNNYAFPLVLETGVKDAQAYAKRKEIETEPAFTATPAALGDCPDARESRSLSMRTVLFPLYHRLSSPAAERVARLLQTLP